VSYGPEARTANLAWTHYDRVAGERMKYSIRTDPADPSRTLTTVRPAQAFDKSRKGLAYMQDDK
jgi:hypothetical protein